MHMPHVGKSDNDGQSYVVGRNAGQGWPVLEVNEPQACDAGCMAGLTGAGRE